MSQETIGIIAGAGQFPFMAARAARERGLRVAVAGFQGHTDPALADEADAFALLKLGQLGKLIKYFKKEGASTLTFAGAINKPRALDLRPDLLAAKILFTLKTKGDDALLRAVAGALESEGMTIVQAAELILELRAPEGVLTGRAPTDEERADLAFAFRAAKQIGALDIGQCLVARQGMVVAVEAIEGTDAALRRGGELGGAGCVAVKTVKPGQDKRIDLPSVGLGTITTCVEAGIACLGVEAHGTLFFDLQESIEAADRAGMAIVGMIVECDGADAP